MKDPTIKLIVILINLSTLQLQSLEETNYQSNIFDFVTSLSVIEHGVDIHKYFMEMNRILKKGGLLLTSTDYWLEKTINTKCVLSLVASSIWIAFRSVLLVAPKLGWALLLS